VCRGVRVGEGRAVVVMVNGCGWMDSCGAFVCSCWGLSRRACQIQEGC